MKRALRGVLVLVVAGIATQVGAAAPARMSLVNSPDSFLLWNRHDGLLGVERCDVAPDANEGKCVSGSVERTSDGGRTYHVVLRTRGPIGGLQRVGSYGAIATTFTGNSWRTFDRGRTWRLVPSQPLTYWLTSRMGISFRTYFVRNQGRLALRVTHDGGATWRRQRDPCQRADIAFSAEADLVTPRLWWIVCLSEPGAGNQDKAIYRTRDGGRTWDAGAATVSFPPRQRAHGGIAEYGYPVGLSFARNGFGVLAESRGTLYVTRDGGVRWRAVPVVRPEIDFAGGATALPNGIAEVFLHSARPRLIETRDYGRTWRIVRRWGH